MADAVARAESGDIAWATFRTPLDKASLLDFCRDLERLVRINPYLEITDWESCGDGGYRFRGRNLSQDPAFDFDLKLQVAIQPDGLQLRYEGGLKSSTTFSIKELAEGSELTITEDYGALTEQERKARLGEVDKSLVKWAEDLQAYLVSWNRWRWFPPWRFYMRRIWLPMKPVARRITYTLLWISLVEIALIALGVAIYLAEYR